MAHSSDRTLLSSLGFSDPDKRDRRHDMACQYLTQAHIALKIGEHCGLCRASAVLERAMPEVCITKGEGKYKTVVGFADLILNFIDTYSGIPEIEEGERISGDDWYGREYKYPDGTQSVPYRYRIPGEEWWSGSETCPKSEPMTRCIPQSCLIEVKIEPVSIGDVLRQVKLYRGYLEISRTVVVTVFPYDKTDVETLRRDRVYHVRLGADFLAYCEVRKSQKSSAETLEL